MVKTSVLNDALNAINNAEKMGKRQVLIRPSSKVIVKVRFFFFWREIYSTPFSILFSSGNLL